MKKLILFSCLILLLAACSSGGSETTAVPATTAPSEAIVSSGPTEIQIAVATNDFAVGTPRVPFILFDGPQQVTDAQSIEITTFDLSLETQTPGWTGPATNYSDYEIPYWVVYPEVDKAGNWGLLAQITRADGSVVQAPFTIQVVEETATPDIGSPAPPSENRTLETEPDIAKLTSGTNPDPGLYQITVAQALQSGKPTVVTMATPAYCQTEICAPVVDSVEAVYDEYKDQANFIHLEIFKDFQALVQADEVAEWGLPSEPWTFVIDANGNIVARFGGPISPRELSEALAPLL